MFHDLLQDSRFYALLIHIDRDLSDAVRRQGCRCGGPLHRANYARKPRGPTLLQDDASWGERLSLCCGREGCRKRATPPSVRFAGRRVYAAVVVVLACLGKDKHMSVSRRAVLKEALGVSARTVVRWLVWWRSAFVQGAFWKLGRGRFMPPVEETLLPTSLLAGFAGSCAEVLISLLRFIAPLSTSSVHAR